MDVTKPVSIYQGGTLNILGPDKVNASRTQVLEGIWHPPPVNDGDEIACVMGACYFFRRDWFLHLNPLQYLRSWGMDEPMLAIKSWLAGGECRYAEKIRIGHKFLIKHERQGFRMPPGHFTWNKLLAIHTLCPNSLVGKLQDALQRNSEQREWAAACQLMKNDWHIIACEQARNRRLFERDVNWLAAKFHLPLPE